MQQTKKFQAHVKEKLIEDETDKPTHFFLNLSWNNYTESKQGYRRTQ